MKKIVVHSYEEFESYCKENFNNEQNIDQQVIVVRTGLDDVLKILNLYQRAANSDNQHASFILNIFLKIDFLVTKAYDYKIILEILNIKDKRITTKLSVKFLIVLNGSEDIEMLNEFNTNVYSILSKRDIKTTAFINFDYIDNNSVFFTESNNLESKNIEKINEIIINGQENELCINDNQKPWIFHIDYKDKTFFDFTSLHKYLLLCSKFSNQSKGFILNITNGDFFRIKAFCSLILSEKIFVVCNNTLIIPETENIGKLPPAIFIKDVVDLKFFQQPLDYNTWQKLIPQTTVDKNEKNIEIHKITAKTFEKSNESVYKYWPYLRMCQKFLFEEFDDNHSKAYTELRVSAYMSNQFYNDYVSKIPFLALFIFSIYDNFYRSNLLLKFKSNLNKCNYVLEQSDFLLSKQVEQDYEKFEIYQKIKSEVDIKNILEVYSNEPSQNKLHITVVSEIFECVSISEGLLQILENAVLHAGGGLFSLRVYSRATGLKTLKSKKEEHVEYLNTIYSENYFNYKKTDFYLEAEISDISSVSMSKKFLKNLVENVQMFEELLKKLHWNTEKFNIFKNQLSTNYFFDNNFLSTNNPNRNNDNYLSYFKQIFYTIDRNLVHHYGLETFNSILTSRDGIFSVTGHNDKYDNLNYIFENVYKKTENFISKSSDYFNIFNDNIERKIYAGLSQQKTFEINKTRNALQKNLSWFGTTYRILLPLDHSSINNVNYNTNSLEFIEKDSFKPVLVEIKNDYAFNEPSSIEIKQKNINDFSQYIKEKYDSKYLWNTTSLETRPQIKIVCLDMHNYNDKSIINRNQHFEEIIKGCLLFALNKLKEQNSPDLLPIAIINLTPFELVEAARIISIYYSKKGYDANSIFGRIQIYLKCRDSSKEILFSGSNLTEIKNNLIKTGMKNGTMFKELHTIINILNKVAKNEKNQAI